MQDNAQHPSPNESDPDYEGAHLDWRRIRIQVKTSTKINKNHVNSRFNVLLAHLVQRYHTSLADPGNLSGPSSKKFLKKYRST